MTALAALPQIPWAPHLPVEVAGPVPVEGPGRRQLKLAGQWEEIPICDLTHPQSHIPSVIQILSPQCLHPGLSQPTWTPISEKPQSPSLPHCPFRYKGRRPESHAPHVPNQPSEAAAHFYFELAKTVLIKAGGNSSTSIFTHPSSSGGHQGPHRNLHLCAFEIGLYALGLHNFVSPNWLSRTYSSHVSWITGKSSVLIWLWGGD